MKEMGDMAQHHLQGGHGNHGHHGHGGYHGNGDHHEYGGHHHGYGGQMNDKKAMKEAMKLAKNKDLKQIDPAVLDYAATRLQAGFRGYMARKGH